MPATKTPAQRRDAAYGPRSEDLWPEIVAQAKSAQSSDPSLGQYLDHWILKHASLSDALAWRMAAKLAEPAESAPSTYELFAKLFRENDILSAIRSDLSAILERDAACSRAMSAFLNYKGFFALSAYRAAHRLWTTGRTAAALQTQIRVAEVWNVDIHPAARIGSGIFIDHGTGLVIGETAVVEDCVSMLHGVTLGGTGKHHGDRHPKVRKNVLIGAGAKILGNIEIGEGARIGAGSVVLKPVPPHSTAVGVPARIIPQPKEMNPAVEMDHANWII